MWTSNKMWTLNDVAFICVTKETFSYYDEWSIGDDGEKFWRHMVDGTQILRQIVSDYPQAGGDIAATEEQRLEQRLTKLPWFRQYLTTARSELSVIFNDILSHVGHDADFRQETMEIRLDDYEREYLINGVSASDIFKNRTEYRNADGTLHREDGPAVVHGQNEEFWLNGKRHREDGPAVVRDGDEEWFLDGKRHRGNDLPAIVRANGDRIWYNDGKLHRVGDLPAVMLGDGTLEWHFFGIIHRDDGPAVIDSHEDEEWWNRGRLHRANGPAMVFKNGDQLWYTRGMLNRDGGLPAICYVNADQTVDREWWVKDECHREDGPAIELSDGTKKYYLNDRQLSEEEYIAYTDFCQRMHAKVRDRAQKKIYFWWIPICHDQNRECGKRITKLLVERDYAEFLEDYAVHMLSKCVYDH